MPDEKLREWQCPPQAADPTRKLGWLNDQAEDGACWVRSQRGASDFTRALDIISGKFPATAADYRSQVNTNHLKRNARESIGALAKLRPLWGYNSDNNAFKDQAAQMNKVTRAWYLEQDADRSIKDALQYAYATCTGWIWPSYIRDVSTGRGAIELSAFGSPCVLPSQVPSSGNFQRAYAVTLLNEMPVFMAHGMFPKFQEFLRPTSSRYWYAADIRKATQGNLWNRMWRRGATDAPGSLPDVMIPIRYTWLIDLALNRTGKTIPMGEPKTSWAYDVPSVGERVAAGRGPDGSQLWREATESDARLYPYRRLLISSESVIMYDGPAFDWHGELPLVPFSLDRWPWEPLGFSPVRDGYEIQATITELERGIVDKARAQNDPALAYDINSVTKREADSFDPMQPRARAGWDASGGAAEPFKMVVDPQIMALGPDQLPVIAHFKEAMNDQMAIADINALARARLGGDDLEKLMQAQGPIIEDMSRSMEPPMRRIGEQVKYLILQYYTTSRVMQYVGPDGVTPATFDFQPSSLIPSHLPGESVGTGSTATPGQRARAFGDNLRFFITPYSLHEMTQMWYKLLLIQLKKAGLMIDSETIANACLIPNYGTIDGNTVMDKWRSEQETIIEMQIKGQALAAALTGESAGGGAPALLALTQALVPPGAVGPGKPNGEGRPNVNATAPQLKVKAGDMRSTITTSEGGGKVV